MDRFVAFLRGINVAGQKAIRMAHLRHTAEKASFTNVETYIQSGNVVFTANDAEDVKGDHASMEMKLHRAILDETGFEVDVFVRSTEELRAVVTTFPFEGVDPAVEDRAALVTFLATTPDPGRFTAVTAKRAPSERVALEGRTVYLYCPDGYGKSKLSNAALEHALSVRATTRNWKTLLTLVRMATSA